MCICQDPIFKKKRFVNRFMNKICIFGKKSVICQKFLSKIKNFDAFDRQEFDVTNFLSIKNFDFSGYDTVINFAGHSKGNYKSPIDNSWLNYVDQVNVNFLSNIMLAKKYIEDNSNGRFIWFSSKTVKSCRPYQAVYGASKSSTEFVFRHWNIEYPNFKFITMRLGRCKTNHLFNTFEHTKSHDEIDAEYEKSPYVDSDVIALKLLKLIDLDCSHTEEMMP